MCSYKISYDSDDARDEEDAALHLQKKDFDKFDANDFEMDVPTVKSEKKKKKTRKKKTKKGGKEKEKKKKIGESKSGGEDTIKKKKKKKKKKTKTKKSTATGEAGDVAHAKKKKKKSKGTKGAALLLSAGADAATDAAKLQLLTQDSPELMGLLTSFKKQSATLKHQLAPLLARIKADELPTTHGISFLEIKFHLLLSYCQNIAFYLLLKAEGQSVKDHPVIESLLRIRTMMERLKPLDSKLKHQIDKLLDAARKGAPLNDLRNTRPDPSDLVDSDDADEQGGAKEGQEGTYRAPKVMAVPYDNGKGSKEQRKEKSLQKRLKQSRLLQEMKEAYSTAPESIKMRTTDPLLEDEERERTRYEEENMQRLPVSKKLKQRRTASRRGGETTSMNDMFEEISDFGNLERLAGSTSAAPARPMRESGYQRQVHALEQHNRKKQTIAWGSADVEVGLRDPEELRRERGRYDPNQEAMAMGMEASKPRQAEKPLVSMDDEDDFYRTAARRQKAKKRKRKEEYTRAPMMTAGAEEVEGNNPRVASKRILKNKGLVAYRKKLLRNPRLVRKAKHAKALKREKGRKPSMRKHEHSYSGEQSGIRDDITHSRQLRK